MENRLKTADESIEEAARRAFDDDPTPELKAAPPPLRHRVRTADEVIAAQAAKSDAAGSPDANNDPTPLGHRVRTADEVIAAQAAKSDAANSSKEPATEAESAFGGSSVPQEDVTNLIESVRALRQCQAARIEIEENQCRIEEHLENQYGIDVGAATFNELADRLLDPQTGSGLAEYVIEACREATEAAEQETKGPNAMTRIRDFFIEAGSGASYTARQVAEHLDIEKVQIVYSCLSTLRGLGWVNKLGAGEWGWSGQADGPMYVTNRLDDSEVFDILDDMLRNDGPLFTPAMLAHGLGREVLGVHRMIAGLKKRGVIVEHDAGTWRILKSALAQYLSIRHPGDELQPPDEAEPEEEVTDDLRRAIEGRHEVMGNLRPPIREAIHTVLSSRTMNITQIIAALEKRGWLPKTKTEQGLRGYISYVVSKNRDAFEQVERGSYRRK
jgi:hypothetical protein